MQKAVRSPDMVSDEEKLIDFETSVSKEEQMEEEADPSVESCISSASAPGASTPVIVELTEVAIPEIAKVGGTKTIRRRLVLNVLGQSLILLQDLRRPHTRAGGQR